MKNSVCLTIALVLSVALQLGQTSGRGPQQVATTKDILKNWENIPISEIKTKAESGVPEAQFVLGKREYEQARTISRKAFGWTLAATSNGKDLTDQEKADSRTKWEGAPETALWSAAEKGERDAQWFMGWQLNGDGQAEKRAQGAVAWLEKAAAQNYAPAEYELGGIYFKGGPAGHDPLKARHWFGRAAQHGSEGAQHLLALMLLKDGEDIPKAVELLREAADQGCALAKFDLAQQYQCGNGEPRHGGDTPLNLIRFGATNDLPEARLALGERFRVGANIRRDVLQAIAWYRRAYDLTRNQRRNDETDHFTIQSNLDANDRVQLSVEELMAVVEDDGRLSPTRPIMDSELVKVLQIERKALVRNPLAQFQFAELFEEGALTQRDPIRAYYYYSLAARKEVPAATAKLEVLKPKLSDNDLKRVQSWIDKYDAPPGK
jgi:TPR repeat protein